MFISMKGDSTQEQIDKVKAEVIAAGFSEAFESRGQETIVVNCIGSVPYEKKLELMEYLPTLPGVTSAQIATTPFRLTAREAHPENFVVSLDGISIGGPQLIVMAGPCAVESREQILTTASAVQKAGAKILRGGAYKPRTSPFSFQGLGEEGLQLLASAREETGLLIITEVMTPEKVELVSRYADILQIGARNMQNYDLLRAVGRVDKPVLLKRGPSATVDDLLLAAEYIVKEGNRRVILCLRGVVGFSNSHKRNSADIDDIPIVKALSHHPVIFDPSHACGKRDLVLPLSLAAIAAGADGLIIEVHPNPDAAKSDGAQSLYPNQFTELMRQIRKIASVVNREV